MAQVQRRGLAADWDKETTGIRFSHPPLPLRLGLTAILIVMTAGWLGAAASSPWVFPSSHVLYQTSFEEGDPIPELSDHKLVESRHRTGKRALLGGIKAANTGCFLRIPFKSSPGKLLTISYWLLGERGTSATLFARTGKGLAKRTRLGSKTDPEMRDWKEVRAAHHVAAGEESGVIEIVAPAGWSGEPGKIWIDDLMITEGDDPVNWPKFVEDFPALACDRSGTLWMALLDRPIPRKRISIYRFEKGERQAVYSFEPEGLTGVAAPAVASLAKGCAVAIPFEKNDRWQIAVVFVDGATGRAAAPLILPSEGNANQAPAVAAVEDRVCVLWHSNGGGSRGIYACWVDRQGAGQTQRLSRDAPHVSSYNPAVVALPDGTLCAAWDSFCDQSANIYGSWFRNGKWAPERRITRAARVERHPSLAVRGSEVWMTWQATSFAAMKLNWVKEQRIAVARLDKDSLAEPLDVFSKISPANALLMRPQIIFDPAGRLWLGVRKSAGPHSGWHALAWCYTGGQWSGPSHLMPQEGRWRPAALAWTPAGGVAAVQYDDRDGTQGIRDDWRSGIAVVGLPVDALPKPAPLVTRPLEMPATDFSVAQKMDLVSTFFPRQTWQHGGENLQLYWGDFHDHTDLSICARSVNPPGEDLFANVRDLERLDFAALTDHGYNLDRPQWAYNGEQTRANHDPGRFVAFLGQEWTSKNNPPEGGVVTPQTPLRYGHRNLIHLDPYYPQFYDAMDGDISPRDLWNQIKGRQYITIPHQLADWEGKGRGNPPTDWKYTDEYLQPVAEIFQARQSYEHLGCPRQAPQGSPFKGTYLQDAWAKGIVIGVIASPDHGGGNGKVAVWAKELTRQAILDAVRARHCYGTSGAKMGLWFNAGAARMGDQVKRPAGKITFHVKALAERDLKELVIIRNNEVVHRLTPNQKQVELDWTDAAPPTVGTLWYYTRIQAVDEELAWSSPIWFKP